MTSGLHHLTLITRKVQANVDFYAGFLGLRLVKRTGGFEDAEQLHLFYGDRLGSPGSLITFLDWEDGSPGRVGHGQIGEFALAIDPASLGFWIERALRFHVPMQGPQQEFGEPLLRLRDPDGIVVKLVGVPDRAVSDWIVADIPAEHAIRRLRGVTLLSEAQEESVAFARTYSGFVDGPTEGGVHRLVSEAGDALDIRDAGGFWPGGPGTGTADHVALRARDADDISTLERALATRNSSVTNVHDRKYFTSLYVREPGGILIEFATDGPGFLVDEPAETLGEMLFVPPDAEARRDDILAMLPQFALPGAERVIYRDLPFVHRFFTPEDPDGSVIVLLHGSGGNEADLMAFGRRVAPRATLLGVRGRSHEEGSPRWFRRFPGGGFDQADIAFEAEAFAAFLDGANTAYGLTPERTAFLGYSNGANLLAAFMLLHPGVARRSVLLRAMSVLEEAPDASLQGTDVLLVQGAYDYYGAFAPALAETLRTRGANVEMRSVETGHALSAEDPAVIAGWLASSLSPTPG